MLVETVNKILAFLALALFSAVVLSGVYYFLDKKRAMAFVRLIRPYTLHLVFLISALSTLGSLFYSEIAGYEPCKLCWLQRIFMYPLVLLSGLALFKKDKKIADYLLLLSLSGLTLSLYHNYIYFWGRRSDSCTALEGGVSCLKNYVTEFDFVTIPFMAMSGFLGVAILSFLMRKKEE